MSTQLYKLVFCVLFFLILGLFPSSLGKKWIYTFHKGQENITRADTIILYWQSENTFKEHPLIFRPRSTVSVGSQAGCDLIKGNAPLLLLAFLRSSFLQTGQGALFPNRWSSRTLLQQTGYRLSTQWGKWTDFLIY